MRMTRVFKSGNSQAVRLPVDFHVNADEVEIFKQNGDIVLRHKPENLTRAFEILTQFPEDFLSEGRVDTPPQTRDF